MEFFSPDLDPRFIVRVRQPGLDLLRALAVAMVVCYHAGLFGFTLPHDIQRFGWIGVDLFFVLSGYLIGGQLLAPIAVANGPTCHVSSGGARCESCPLTSRCWRFTRPFLPGESGPSLPPLWKFLIFVQNLDLQGGTAFSHAWSLCVEGQFYLALPFLLLLILPLRQGGTIVASSVIVAGIVLRATLAYSHPAPPREAGFPGERFNTSSIIPPGRGLTLWFSGSA